MSEFFFRIRTRINYIRAVLASTTSSTQTRFRRSGGRRGERRIFGTGDSMGSDGAQCQTPASQWISRSGGGPRYFAAFFFFARARRSVFFRRLARFLALSLPLLFPIIPNTLPLTSNRKSADKQIRRGEHQKFFGDLRPLVGSTPNLPRRLLDLLRGLDNPVFLGPVPKRRRLCRRRFEPSPEMRPVAR